MTEKKRKVWFIWGLALILAGGGVGGWKHRARENTNGKTQYRTAPLQRGEIVQTVTANGALGAVQTVTVGSEVSGKIVELFADFNSAVTNGQILARLDSSTYERQLEQARAQRDSAQASLRLSEANYRRAKELLDLKLVSEADYDQAEAQVSQARASLRMQEANLSKVQVDLMKTTIFSPMDGVVISRAVDVGQTVAASLNAPTLFTLAQDLRKMRIQAEISEADIGGVEEGQDVTFTVDAYPSRTFFGSVSQVRFQPVTSQNVVNYIAIVDVDNADLKLRPGMTANASIITARRENALRLPNAALRFRPPEATPVVSVPVETPPVPAAGVPPEGAVSPAPNASPSGPPEGERTGRFRGRSGHTRRGGGAEGEPVHRTVYVQDKAQGLIAKTVSLGISDGNWTEVLGGTLSEGDELVTGIQAAHEEKETVKAGSTSPFMPTPPRMRR